MQRRLLTHLVYIGTLLLSLLLVLSVSLAQEDEAQAVFRIGVLDSPRGPITQGAQLAVRQINEAGGVEGRRMGAGWPQSLDEGGDLAPDAPDPTAWGLHGSLHRRVPHARCALHVHSKYATVLASLEDSRMPAIDQNTAMFHDRVVIDEEAARSLAQTYDAIPISALNLETTKPLIDELENRLLRQNQRERAQQKQREAEWEKYL